MGFPLRREVDRADLETLGRGGYNGVSEMFTMEGILHSHGIFSTVS